VPFFKAAALAEIGGPRGPTDYSNWTLSEPRRVVLRKRRLRRPTTIAAGFWVTH